MELTYVKTNSVNLDSIPKVDGQLISVSENSRRYLDFDGIRQGIATSSEIDAITNVYGAKNLLPTGESGTYSGLTFTVNADGSITISGTATDNVYYTIACPKLYAGDYILTGYPSSAIGMNCSLYYDGVPGSDTGDGQPFTLSQYVGNKNVYIFVLGGTNFTTPATFYPMIRDARITDSTYVPYAMTNRELTEEIDTIKEALPDTGWITLNETYPTIYRHKNGYITVIMRLSGGATPTDGFVLGTLPNAYKPGVEICVATHNLRGCILIDTNGDVIIQANSGYALNNYMAAVVIFPT